ncbi:hypothetical protein BRD14_03355 [Halobacteriales archaeon SW_5_68_122]|nr:MAG: hypothetical protein BRD14_03355 [Halobacteriales archaeon SW_5_68_122]
MLPWGHLAVGYLAYSLAVRVRSGGPPAGLAVAALGVGTQFPDLIDKPLVSWMSVLPAGRSLGHSLLFAAVCGVGLWYLGRRVDRPDVAAAFLFGQLAHVVADALPAALDGRWSELGFLLWPATPVFRYPGDDRELVGYLLSELTTPPHHELGLFALAVALWVADGRPGLPEARSWLAARCRALVSPPDG